MKNLIVIFAFLTFGAVSLKAGVVNEQGVEMCVNNVSVPTYYIRLALVDVPENPTSFPYVISVPAPTETVIGVSGPTRPNVSWDIQGGMLNIYLYQADFNLLEGSSIIEVATNPMKYYYIELSVI